MKVLEAGTLRYLLIAHEEVERNFQRRAARGTVALVAEDDPARPGAFIYHDGFGAMAEGPIALVYNPTGSAATRVDRYTGRRVHERAAYATYGRIAIAESVEEAESLVLTEPAPLGTSDSPDDGTQTGTAGSTETTTETPAADARGDAKRPSQKQPKVAKPEEGNK